MQRVQKIVGGNENGGKLDTRTEITERGEEWGKKGGKPVRESAEVEKSRW